MIIPTRQHVKVHMAWIAHGILSVLDPGKMAAGDFLILLHAHLLDAIGGECVLKKDAINILQVQHALLHQRIAHGILNGIIVMKQNVGIIQIMKVIAIARQEDLAVHGTQMECIVMNPHVGHMIMIQQVVQIQD